MYLTAPRISFCKWHKAKVIYVTSGQGLRRRWTPPNSLMLSVGKSILCLWGWENLGYLRLTQAPFLPSCMTRWRGTEPPPGWWWACPFASLPQFPHCAVGSYNLPIRVVGGWNGVILIKLLEQKWVIISMTWGFTSHDFLFLLSLLSLHLFPGPFRHWGIGAWMADGAPVHATGRRSLAWALCSVERTVVSAWPVPLTQERKQWHLHQALSAPKRTGFTRDCNLEEWIINCGIPSIPSKHSAFRWIMQH